jgi:signal transduction histidine kinase
LEDLKNKENLIFTPDYLLVNKAAVGRATEPATYVFFPRPAWSKFIAKEPIEIQHTDDFENYHRLARNVGWKVNHGMIARQRKQSEWVTEVSMLGICAGIMSICVLVGQTRRRKKQLRTLVVQTLTHELRTPVANMQYTMDEFRKRFESLTPRLQDAFLSLCEDNQRLVELIRASSGLLRSEHGQKHFYLPQSGFNSANELIAALLEPYAQTVSFVPSMTDFRIRTDSYWLGICLRNLVKNAVQHGKPPILVTLAQIKSECIILVEDKGAIRNSFFFPLVNPFRNRTGDGGLGLGLKITKEIIGLLGGRLRIRRNPNTRISIELPRGDVEERKATEKG